MDCSNSADIKAHTVADSSCIYFKLLSSSVSLLFLPYICSQKARFPTQLNYHLLFKANLKKKIMYSSADWKLHRASKEHFVWPQIISECLTNKREMGLNQNPGSGHP